MYIYYLQKRKMLLLFCIYYKMYYDIYLIVLFVQNACFTPKYFRSIFEKNVQGRSGNE